MLIRTFFLLVVASISGGSVIEFGNVNCKNKVKHPKLVKTLSEGNLKFALDLYKQTAKGRHNVFISPFSVGVALAMTSAGAGGKTLSQMTDTLQLNDFSDEHNVHQAIHSVLNTVCSNTNYEVFMANRIYVRKDFAVETSYKNILTDWFDSSIETSDFIEDTNEETKRINKWVGKHTFNHIKNLFLLGNIDSSTVLALVNAIYFKGNWGSKFPDNKTKPESFKLTKRRKKLTPMMNLSKKLNYTESKELDSQIIELPFQGDRLVMYVILPNDVDSLKELKKQLTAESFTSFKKAMLPRNAIVKLPKFKINYKNELNEILSKMGMIELFDRNRANLSRIAQTKDSNLYVSIVVHQASISVDEKGAEADATKPAGVVGPVSVLLNVLRPTVNFNADHPFIFIIYDKLTELVLFIGSISDPSE